MQNFKMASDLMKENDMLRKTVNRWTLAFVVLGAFGLAGAVPQRSLAQTTCQTFEQTGKEVCFEFLDYWNQHGGLAQQGYPITEQISEVSPTDGQSYRVQYFERAVFELHPENQPPNNILLSLLGQFAYKDRYPTGAPNQQPNTSADSRLFTETGHRVGGKFLDYWQKNGGLAQQGYPISDEFTEKSSLDGKEYRVQYFERAVFELHPENQAPYDVLLSQLGTSRLRERVGEQVTFKTSDGVDLVGHIWGSGKTGVLLSAMCYNTPTEDWDNFARLLAKQGYMVMTYLYRGIPPSSGKRTSETLDLDIDAAAQYMKSRGAEEMVLAGGSCGGTMSVLEATRIETKALVVLASPQLNEGLGASDEALKKLTMPKFLAASEDDQWFGPTFAMFDKMPDPKIKQVYTGRAHGTELFGTQFGDDLTQKLLAFIKTNAPAK